MNHQALHKISYGIYIVSSRKDKSFNGQICNTVFQVTSEPPAIAISISKQNYTHEFILASRVFTVSILLKTTPLDFIGRFGFKCGRDIDKFQGVKFNIGTTGAPIVLDNTTAYLEAEVIKEADVGTHTIFIGRIVEAEVLNNGEPMTYEYYHEIKRGATPKSAPTYTEEKRKETASEMDKYKCTVCGYVYEPEKGDPDSGIKPGTPFEKLPDDWVCPICGAAKDQFEKI